MHLILKENKKFDNNLFGNITKIIYNSEIKNDEKHNLKLIFEYVKNKIINIQNLINSNNQFLNYINKINDDIVNKIKDKININENKYVINSNYIMKLIININKENLNQNEINKINYLCNINKLCKEIMEKYIHYLMYNSKINNIYIYQNKLLLFIGEQYLFVPFSFKSKKFLGIESGNLIKTNSNNFNNFKIIKITCDKIIINDEGKKNVNIIEVDNNGNSNTYNFYLVKNSFNYHTNALVDKKYLLIDNINNNNLNFSLINLDNYSIEKNYYDFCRLLNFKIDNNPPKIYLTENFSKFIYLYKGNNQVSVIDFSLNKQY